MSIPLAKDNSKDSINTSIIAIKRQIERINMLLGLSNSEEIDTSVFATKDELQQAITDLQPVDEVTADNMQSVTSNAVAEEVKNVNNNMFAVIEGEKTGIALSPNSAATVVVNYSVPSGYKAICITGYDITGAGGTVVLYSSNVNEVFGKTGNKSATFWLYNNSSGSRTVDFIVGILCQKII